MNLARLLLILVCALLVSVSALASDIDPAPGGQPGRHPGGHPGMGNGHFADGHGAWAPHLGWHGNIQHFNTSY